MTALLDAVRRFADAHADDDGLAPTPVPGLMVVRATAPSGLIHDMQRPLACLVQQGAKQVTTGTQVVSFSAGDALLVTADVPTVSRITRASAAAPYYSLVLELDPGIIAGLVAQMPSPAAAGHAALHVDPTDAETADAALRLMRLLDRPDARAVLAPQLLREMHYWLLCGRHGEAIRRLGWPEGPLQRISRAVRVLRRDYTLPVAVEALAAEAGMSASSFHRHFRRITSLSPLQFQKRLRLIEARRLMQSQGANASTAAYAVGYESVPQFTREYRRMFGQPPAADARTSLARVRTGR